MRHNFSLAVAGKIMVQDFNGFSCVQFSRAIEVAYHLLFLRIHADHRLVPCKILRFDFCDVLKLGVTFWMLLERLLFLGLATCKFILFQQLAGNVATYRNAIRRDSLGNSLRFEVRPDDVVLRTSCRMFRDDFKKKCFPIQAWR